MGLSINSVNLSGNKYVNFVIVTAIEIPSYWIAIFLMGTIGRKRVLIGGFSICCIFQVSYVFIPQSWYAVLLTVYLIGKFDISMVLTATYIYTAELYPTRYRNNLFASTAMIGTIGIRYAPLAPAIGTQWFEALPLLYASLALVYGALLFLTPETLGTKLPDTLQQAFKMSLRTTI